ncbi:mRNA cap guanine-N7 methyltransferase-like isoform X1 [Penaeus japonicus]|uniref:mRNA cap guanine-N7 methyltransferase-like isoform X1 n=2 Tax=Penaeus japonicus TaxID=27405 RepID=UPI001C71240C|nr:mRNA cap guanine-N7 methyltransferase-like isoform X1 [Penaeus japonicus]
MTHLPDELGEDKMESQVKRIKYEDNHNEEEGLGSVVADHYNKLQNKGVKERAKSRIFYMRNFNNWIKSYLINYCLEQVRERQVDDYPISVLDLGCGKGGDLLKWQKGNIKHLICADIAAVSMEECKERYEINKRRARGPLFSAEFIVADCTKMRIKNQFENSNRMVDFVSCQFAFHYCFESLSQAETMLRNISENLKKGGYFIATIPNAYEIMLRLKNSEDGLSFGNEVYRIKFPEDRPATPPLFGDRYNFYLQDVVDCPEFLIHPPTLERLAAKWGLKQVWIRDFQTLYEDAVKDREYQNLLSIMKALENYPTNEQETETEGEYSHAEDHLTKNERADRIRTLSKSEWDAIRIYQACLFRKVT